jgi:hypothetical protein
VCGLIVDGQALEGTNLLGVDLRGATTLSPGIEHYARGGDLIATYDETPQRPLRAQVYWRAAGGERLGVIAAIELLASVQTSLLDTCPQLTTCSSLTASDMFRLLDSRRGTFESATSHSGSRDGTPSCFVFRLASLPISYVEMVAPSAVQTTQLTTERHHESLLRVRLVHQLFAERLEKGVILRARVLGLMVERDDDLAVAARDYAAFVAAAPPLTT